MSNILQAMMGAAGRSQTSLAPEYVIIGGAFTGRVDAYPFDYSTGFGTIVTAPASIPSADVVDIDKLGDSIFLTVSGTTQNAYPFTLAGGWGTRVDSATLDKTAFGGGISANYMIIAQNDNNYAVLPITDTPTFGTRGTDISRWGDGFCVAFNSDNTYVALGGQNSDRVRVFPWNDSTGTVGTVADTYNSNEPNDLVWAPDDSFLFVVGDSDLYAITWTGSAFSTVYTQSLAGTGNSVAVTSDGAYVAVAHRNSPYLSIYPFSGGTFGTVVQPTGDDRPDGQGQAVTFSRDDSVILVGHQSSPYVSAYQWSSGTLGTKYSAPATPPNAVVDAVLIY